MGKRNTAKRYRGLPPDQLDKVHDLQKQGWGFFDIFSIKGGFKVKTGVRATHKDGYTTGNFSTAKTLLDYMSTTPLGKMAREKGVERKQSAKVYIDGEHIGDLENVKLGEKIDANDKE